MNYEVNSKWWALLGFSKTLVRFVIINKTYRDDMTREFYYKLNPY